MASESLGLLNFIWTVISGLAVAGWIAVPIIWKKLRPFWIGRPRLKSSRRGAKDLKELVKFLGQVQEWLSSMQTELVTRIRHDLCKIEWNIWLEALSYIALHSNVDNQRCLALRNLSQVDDTKSMDSIEIGRAHV